MTLKQVSDIKNRQHTWYDMSLFKGTKVFGACAKSCYSFLVAHFPEA